MDCSQPSSNMVLCACTTCTDNTGSRCARGERCVGMGRPDSVFFLQEGRNAKKNTTRGEGCAVAVSGTQAARGPNTGKRLTHSSPMEAASIMKSQRGRETLGSIIWR